MKKKKAKKENKEEELQINRELEGKPEDTNEIEENSDENPKSEPKEKTPEQIIEDLETNIKEQEDRYLRLVAEFDNYKKRNARLYESMVQSSRESILSPLLEVIDNFERALESSENSDFKSFKKGTELINQQLNELLKKEGVKPIEAVGQEFNPNLHEAMMQVESDKFPEGIIVDEVARGYKLKDRVIRFSKVSVSKGNEKSEDER